jgi:hypothetical protein
MDGGLLPTGNRHTRHLTTFSLFFLLICDVYIPGATHTHIYIHFRLSTFILLIVKKKKFDIECHYMVILSFIFHFTFFFLCMYNHRE